MSIPWIRLKASSNRYSRPACGCWIERWASGAVCFNLCEDHESACRVVDTHLEMKRQAVVENEEQPPDWRLNRDRIGR